MRRRWKVRYGLPANLGASSAYLISLEYVAKYATKDAADEAGEDSESEDEMSSVGDFESEDEEPAGPMEVWPPALRVVSLKGLLWCVGFLTL